MICEHRALLCFYTGWTLVCVCAHTHMYTVSSFV